MGYTHNEKANVSGIMADVGDPVGDLTDDDAEEHGVDDAAIMSASCK